MSNYSPLTNFANKDALSTGDANKRTKGTEITAELNAISTAINSKEDTANKNVNNGYAGLDSSGLLPNARLQAALVTGTSVSTGIFLAGDGLVGTPSFTFTSDPDTGIYHVGANSLGITVGGGIVLQANTTDVRTQGAAVFLTADGTSAAPGFSFFNDPDTGIYRVAANNIAVALGTAIAVNFNGQVTTFGPGFGNGDRILLINNAARSASNLEFYFNYAPLQLRVYGFDGSLTTGGTFRIDPLIYAQDGAIGSPAYSFTADTNTGIYRSAADVMRFATGGTDGIIITNTEVAIGSGHIIGATDGAVGGPAYSFDLDTDTGIYRVGSNNFAFVSGGNTVADIVAAITGSVRIMDYGSTLQVVGFRNIPQNAQTGNYTMVLGDSGKHIYHANAAGAAAYTIPANASVAFDIGTVITFINRSATSITIAITTDTLTWSVGGATGTRTLAQYGLATATKITATEWLLTGVNIS